MRHSPSTPAGAPEGPILALNTTPLIDVMLVLLIMFIVTIPAATHKLPMSLPSGPPPHVAPPAVHRIGLDASGALSWDGIGFPEAALAGRLTAFRAATPEGVIELRADGEARYEAVDRVLATVKRSGIERLAFVGNEHFADLD
jgi:biopolymer transport protein ExbD